MALLTICITSIIIDNPDKLIEEHRQRRISNSHHSNLPTAVISSFLDYSEQEELNEDEDNVEFSTLKLDLTSIVYIFNKTTGQRQLVAELQGESDIEDQETQLNCDDLETDRFKGNVRNPVELDEKDKLRRLSNSHHSNLPTVEVRSFLYDPKQEEDHEEQDNHVEFSTLKLDLTSIVYIFNKTTGQRQLIHEKQGRVDMDSADKTLPQARKEEDEIQETHLNIQHLETLNIIEVDKTNKTEFGEISVNFNPSSIESESHPGQDDEEKMNAKEKEISTEHDILSIQHSNHTFKNGKLIIEFENTDNEEKQLLESFINDLEILKEIKDDPKLKTNQNKRISDAQNSKLFATDVSRILDNDGEEGKEEEANIEVSTLKVDLFNETAGKRQLGTDQQGRAETESSQKKIKQKTQIKMDEDPENKLNQEGMETISIPQLKLINNMSVSSNGDSMESHPGQTDEEEKL